MTQQHPSKSERKCQVCGKGRGSTLLRAAAVRPAIAELVKEATGEWDERGFICENDLQDFRRRYMEDLLRKEKGELTELEREVVESLRQHEILARNPDAQFEADLKLGQMLADKIADFGGSWTFIIFFGVVILIWITLNALVLGTRPFDPYPFILLNLVLSCLAAMQAPVIMMSQNRQEARDRSRSTHDYQVNLKAELEIRHLHQKVDHLLTRQWERLVEIQDIQMELINEVRARK